MRELKVFDTVHPIPQPVSKDAKVFIARTASPVDSFLIEEVERKPGVKTTFIVNDIGILFNQQRLMQLNPMLLQKWLGVARKSSVDTSNLSDDDLIKYMKSRYVQSPADVLSWSRYLQNEIDTVVADAVAKKKAEEEAAAAAAAADGRADGADGSAGDD